MTQAIEQQIEALMAKVVSGEISQAQGEQQYQQLLAQSGNDNFKVWLQQPGQIEDIRLLQAPRPELGEGEILVDMACFALNFGDLLCARGLYPTMPPYPYTPGFEGAGTVMACAPGVTEFVPGDEVVVLADADLGIQAKYVTAKPHQLVAKPKALNFDAACALPVVSMTIIEAFKRAKIKPGETVLIQTAAGGTGLVALQLAKAIGAKVIATAGAQHKLDFLTALGVDAVINYREQDFAEVCLQMTQGRGVDVVLNTLADEAMQKGMNILAERGRYVEIAMTALKSARNMDLTCLSDNQSFISVDLRKLSMIDRDYSDALWQNFCQLVELGAIKGAISNTFALEDIHQAYRCLDDRNNIGKVVVNCRAWAPSAVARPNIDLQNPQPLQTSDTLSAAVQNVLGANASHPVAQSVTALEPIAVVGMSGRFGRANDIDGFWQSLASGESLIEEVPSSRWSMAGLFDPSRQDPNKAYAKWGSFLTDIDCFDAAFFNISGVEAKYMDPQQRILLEQSWRALENGALFNDQLDGSRSGIYVGTTGGDYRELIGNNGNAQSFWGNAGSVAAARLAYFLNLKGPAVAIDTACSSSLVALHMACQSLWQQETDLMLAGGIFIQSTSSFFMLSCKAGMLSPQGQCFTFDARANGFAPGEGVGMLALKRLSDAEGHGDPIQGVIVASGINQDGTTNGITSPSVLSQRDLCLQVYDKFAIDAEQIGYVEAHGTGTELGDPIEVHALNQTFSQNAERLGKHITPQSCALGSVKTNIGHTASAAGVAGVIKVLLAQQHKQLPPSLNFTSLNPKINLADGPFYVNDSLKPWPTDKPLAAISSFGFSGTNAHVVIKPGIKQGSDVQLAKVLLPLSAKSKPALVLNAQALASFLAAHPKLNPADVAYTLQTGRIVMNHRVAIVATDLAQLIQGLNDFAADKPSTLWHYSMASEPGMLRQMFEQDDDAKHLLGQWLSKGKVDKLAQLWSEGLAVNWHEIYPQHQTPKRLALPGYQFEKQRYWIEPKATASWLGNVEYLKSSGELGLVFTLDIDQTHPAWREHSVAELPVLPGVVTFELALQAASKVAQGQSVAISEVNWLQPLYTQDNPKPMLSIKAKGHDHNHFGVTLFGDKGEFVRCALVVVNKPSAQRLDIEALKHNAQQQWYYPSKAEADLGFYQGLAKQGIGYGDYFKTLRGLWLGQGFTLCEIALDGQYSSQMVDLALLDGAMQSAALEVSGEGLSSGPDGLFMPAALGQFVRFDHSAKPVTKAYVLAQRVATDGDSGVRLNVQIVDDKGRLLYQMHDYLMRKVQKPKVTAPLVSETLHYRSRWAVVSDTAAALSAKALIVATQGQGPLLEALAKKHNEVDVIMLGSEPLQLPAHVRVHHIEVAKAHDIVAFASVLAVIADKGKPQAVYFISGGNFNLADARRKEVIDRYAQTGIAALSAWYSAWRDSFSAGEGQTALYLCTVNVQSVPGRATQCAGAEVAGFALSLAQGDTRFALRNLDLTATDLNDGDALAQQIMTQSPAPLGQVKVLINGQTLVRRIEPLQLTEQRQQRIKNGGVYVIVGGSGVVGQIMTRALQRRYQAKVVWIGRRKPEQLAQVLAGFEGKLDYHCCDITDAEQLMTTLLSVYQAHGQINGVLHAANDIAPKAVDKLTPQQLTKMLKPKVSGSLNLLEAINRISHGKMQQPDFVVFFSSIAAYAFLPAADTAPYCAGIAFSDALAAAQADASDKVPVYTINWGYWQDSFERDFARALQYKGYGCLTAEQGVDAFEQVLAYGLRQSIVMHKLAHFSPQAGAETFTNTITRLACHQQISAGEPLSMSVMKSRHHLHQQPSCKGDGISVLKEKHRRSSAALCEFALSVATTQLGFVESGQFGRLQDKYHPFVAELKSHLPQNSASQQALPAVRYDSVKLSRTVNELLAQYPEQGAQIVLLGNCLDKLPEILTGKVAATDVLFAESSMDNVAGVYKNNPVADLFNLALAEHIEQQVKARLEQLKPGEKIRLLEIGAGTGGASAGIFAVLKRYQAHLEYVYTDLSLGFLQYAKQQYGELAPYMRTTRLDIGKPLTEQGIEPGTFDIVLAANVLHATSDMDVTLAHAKSALKCGGVLALSEISEKNLLLTLTFGLTDGWWLCQDPHYRLPGSPVLTPQVWCGLLQAHGFEQAQTLDEALAGFGQQIIVAMSDGVMAYQGQATSLQKTQPITQHTLPQVLAKASSTKLMPQREAAVPSDKIAVLKALLAETLQLDPTGFDGQTPFSDYGMDSILSVKFADAIAAQFAIDFNTADLFNYTNIEALSRYIESIEGQVSSNVINAQHVEPQYQQLQLTPLAIPSTVALPNRADSVDLTAKVLEVLAETLQLPLQQLDADRAFTDLGMDSILAVKFADSLNQTFGCTLSTADLFNYTNGTDIAKYIAGQNPAVATLSHELATIEPIISNPITAPVTTDADEDFLHQQFSQGQLSAEALLTLLDES